MPLKIFVGGLPTETNEEDLMKVFGKFGQVDNAKIVKQVNGMSKGYAFVTYALQEIADMVLTEYFDEIFFRSKNINIGPAMRRLAIFLTKSDLAKMIKLSNEMK